MEGRNEGNLRLDCNIESKSPNNTFVLHHWNIKLKIFKDHWIGKFINIIDLRKLAVQND